MSLVYTASLDDKYAGRPLRIYDAAGDEVAGSPFTLDDNGDYSYTADAEGLYTGAVDNPAVFAGDGESVVNLVLDVPASIAAGGGGADLNLNNDVLTIEINDGATVPLNGDVLPWDTAPDGITIASSVLTGFDPGFYSYMIEIDWDAPAEDRTVIVTVSSTSSSPNTVESNTGGAFHVSADASSWRGVQTMYSGTIVIADGAEVTVGIRGDVVSHTAAPSPAAWSVSYASLSLRKIA